MRLDLLHLSRSLRRSPASAAAAILTLAVTIAAAASIVSVVDGVLLTPPPFTDPAALVALGETPIEGPTSAPRTVSYATFEAWRERAQGLASIEAFDGTNLILTGLGAAERVKAADVTPGFLGGLGVSPVRGRMFAADDAGQSVAIISHGFWQSTLAGDRGVIGRQIVLGGRPHAIVGVLPDAFHFALSITDIWRPLPLMTTPAARANARVSPIARLAAGSSAARLARVLDEVSVSSAPPSRTVATPVALAIAGDGRRTLGLLSGAAALALVIAFINLAGLLLVRSVDRRRELAVRMALGAAPAEIARQLLLEATALVALGTAAGIVLAMWAEPLVRTLALQQFGDAAADTLGMNWRVVGGISMMALVSACLAGALPALGASRRSVVDVLRRGTTAAPGHMMLRRVFVSSEVALAFVLLSSMALLGRTLFAVLAENPGFESRGVLVMHVALPASYSTDARVAAFYATLQDALAGRLGERTASVVDELPLTHDRGRGMVTANAGEPGPETVLRSAGSGYFDVMRIPLLAGRTFDAGDTASAPPRAIVSSTLAAQLFPAGQAVGQHVRLGSRQFEIVGVVGDVKHRALDDPALPTLYFAAAQAPSRSSLIVVRSERPQADIVAAVRDEVARLDGSLPVYGVQTMDAVVSLSPGVPARRLLSATFLAFSIPGVVLSAIGLFGVAAHEVASRRQELALRMALGADPLRILKTTLGRGAAMLGSGLAAGGVLSFWAVRVLATAGVAPREFDAVTAGIAISVLAVAGTAALLPTAIRAARTDPMIALKGE